MGRFLKSWRRGEARLAAFVNSDGDLEMLQWTMAGEGARLAVIIHHTDGSGHGAGLGPDLSIQPRLTSMAI